MKVFFDTNVYVAEAFLGETAARMLAATEKAGWRIYAGTYLLDELVRVLTDCFNSHADWQRCPERESSVVRRW